MRMNGIEVDWNNYQSVCRFADSMGCGLFVIKYNNRPNYNIVHEQTYLDKLESDPTVRFLYTTTKVREDV